MLSHYQIGSQRFTADTDAFRHALAGAHEAKSRPACLCRTPGVPMCIVKASGKFFVRCMPGTGGDHAPACDSYEPPPELSGLGQVMGSAIRDDPDAGSTALRLDYALTRTGGRQAPVPSGVESDSVKADSSKLTLRGTLHYLWEQAGFNRWSPAMTGRRSWAVIRRFLLEATEGKTTKGENLADVLYVPETFQSDRKGEIAERRLAKTSKATALDGKGARRLMLVIAEVKEIAPSRYGHKLVFKHLPDADSHFMLNEDLHQRLLRRFEVELGLWDAFNDTHLVAIATFGIGAAGIASIEEIALMCVTSNWIPFDDNYDKLLIEAMTAAGRRFSKGLRYNLSSQQPLACLVASDTAPLPTAMYIATPAAGAESGKALEALIAQSDLPHWLWRVSDGQMPPLPAVQGPPGGD
jgi:Protein of unknown function (DUF1173)